MTDLSWLTRIPASTTQEHAAGPAGAETLHLVVALITGAGDHYRRTPTGDAVAALVEEVERLTAERAALLAPVEGVGLEEVLRLDREGTPGPWVVEMDGDGDEFTTWEWPWRIKGVVNFADEGDNRNDPTLIAYYRTAAPALARALMAERAHVREVEASEKRLMQEAEELRLTLAAEQGRAEGAPSPGWEPCRVDDDGGWGWRKKTADGFLFAQGARVIEPVESEYGLQRHPGGWERWLADSEEFLAEKVAHGLDDTWTARAAMLAADAATEAR